MYLNVSQENTPKKRKSVKSFSFEMLAFFTKTFCNRSQFLADAKGRFFVRRCCVGFARKIDQVFSEGGNQSTF